MYTKKRMDSDDDVVFISHSDLLKEGNNLAKLVAKLYPNAKISICQNEMFSGAHAGPRMLALFFWGKKR